MGLRSVDVHFNRGEPGRTGSALSCSATSASCAPRGLVAAHRIDGAEQ
jgi:hypothetical protein